MNISEQLNLLKNIKNSIKNRLIERKADIDDNTPFSQYARCILTIDRTVFTDKTNGSTNKKDNSSRIITDKYNGSTNKQDISLINVTDKANIVNETDYVSCINDMAVSNGILNGFAANKYAVLPNVFTPNNSSWEIVIKTHYIANSNTQWLISPNSSAPFGNILFGINNSGRLYILLGTNNSAWNIANTTGSAVLTNNTDYYFKLEFTGSYYNLYYSLNGTNWTKDIETASSSVIYQGQGLALGLEVYNKGSNSYWKGSIDLTESYIKINGSVWWIGSTIIYIL